MPSRKVGDWPLTASEFLTLSPAQQKVEQGRRKLSVKKLATQYRAKMQDAIETAPDLDTYVDRFKDALIEFQRPLAEEFLKKRHAVVGRMKQLGSQSAVQKKERMEQWHSDVIENLSRYDAVPSRDAAKNFAEKWDLKVDTVRKYIDERRRIAK